jgi:hypothetical protein
MHNRPPLHLYAEGARAVVPIREVKWYLTIYMLFHMDPGKCYVDNNNIERLCIDVLGKTLKFRTYYYLCINLFVVHTIRRKT